MKTSYEFTLPRGFVDNNGDLHRTGSMRLATARDELEPLRDPRITGPDDPRLTIMVLARVIEQLGSLPRVSIHDIEGMFAVDLAFLQDFYGVINFGTQDEYEALLAAQQGTSLVSGSTAPTAAASPEPAAAAPPDRDAVTPSGDDDEPPAQPAPGLQRPIRSVEYAPRTTVNELPRPAL